MEPVRILHIVHLMSRGGMESRIMDLYRGLDRSRFQYDFYVESGKEGTFDEEIRDLGGNIYYRKTDNRHNIPDFKAFRSFLHEHREIKLVYAYNQWSGWYLKEAGKCGIETRIAYARTSIQTFTSKNLVKNIVKFNVNKYASHRFAVSNKAAEWLFGKDAVRSGKVTVWPNSIYVKKYAFKEEVRKKVREELGLGSEFTVIHLGNIRYEKNHPFLIKVFSEVKKIRKDAVLVLVGGGDIDSLTPEIQKLDLEGSVKYLGVRSDVSEILQAGDVFVFPSWYEGFPGAVLEAEASGLNCVVSDSITDEVMLTENLISLSLKETPEKWADVACSFPEYDRSNSWKVIEEAGYDVDSLIGRIERFYEEVV